MKKNKIKKNRLSRTKCLPFFLILIGFGNMAFSSLKVTEKTAILKINVRDFGAIPNDGNCDAAAIEEAIKTVNTEEGIELVFEKGIYNFKNKPSSQNTMIYLNNLTNLTLIGQASTNRVPLTVFQMNLNLGNDIEGISHISINNCKKVKIENIVFDHYPRFGTAGEIVSVDKENDIVSANIFPGMPHFEGMKCYSANNWDLDTKKLIPVEALTIGVDNTKFKTWEKVNDTDDPTYSIQGMGFSNRVEVGQGISWHFNVSTPNGENVKILNSKKISMENTISNSLVGVFVLAAFNKDLTFNNVRVEPEGNSLAVGPRDAFHMSRNTGTLLMDSVYIKGVRWDPINIRSLTLKVIEKTGDNQIKAYMEAGTQDIFGTEESVIFWVGEHSVERVLLAVEASGTREYLLTFTEALPESVIVGSYLTPGAWNWNQAAIRNSTIESNYGTAIVYQSENLLVENSYFNNNAYGNITLGPIGAKEGSFTRNIIIQNNKFEQSTWINKFNKNDGTITTFNHHPGFNNQPNNEHIIIQNNQFKDLNIGDDVNAIYLQNVQDVKIRDNTYINVNSKIKIDTASTKDINY